MRLASKLSMLFVSLALSACVNNYEKFYQDYSQKWATGIASPSKPPSVCPSSGSPIQDVKRMFERGYVNIGESSFNAEAEPKENALAKAKEVGAECVIIYSQYTGTDTGSIPFTTTTPVTTYQSGSVNTFSGSYSAFGNYRGTSTTYVPQTTYIPYSIDRYDQNALFFAPMKESCFGVLSEDMTDDQKRMVGSNKGFVVSAVRHDSPADLANLLPGDIVTAVDGDAGNLDKFLSRSGETISLTVFRAEKNFVLPLTLGKCE